MLNILFVCHGNICRSAMAEFMMKDLVRKAGLQDQFHIESAGVSNEESGNDLYPPSKAKLREKGVPFERHHARQITKADFSRFDVIFAMDASNLRALLAKAGKDARKVHPLLVDRSVADPWYTGDFEKAYQDIDQGVKTRFAQLRSQKI